MVEAGVIFAVVSAILFGANIIPARRGLVQSESLYAGVLLSLVSALPIFAGLAWLFGELPLLARLSGSTIAFLGLAGLLTFVVGRTLAYRGTKLIGINRSVPLITSFPLYSVVLATLFLAEPALPTVVASAALVVFSVYLVSSRSRQGEAPPANMGRGVASSLGAAVAYGTAPLFVRVGVLEAGSPIVGALISYLFGLVVYAALFVAAERSLQPLRMGRLSVGLFVLAGILINLAQLFRYLALGTAAVSVVTPVIATSPIFALLFSFAFVRRLETFSWRVVLAGGLAVLSIYLVS